MQTCVLYAVHAGDVAVLFESFPECAHVMRLVAHQRVEGCTSHHEVSSFLSSGMNEGSMLLQVPLDEETRKQSETEVQKLNAKRTQVTARMRSAAPEAVSPEIQALTTMIAHGNCETKDGRER